ncbi:GspH/FimT family pseudopilin [Aquabacterium sp. J223]|uniref:GspH/FimT family pseudopilin n=1 Tax=Aquabacterium sp. J223 TaxID=2898431 RepID=UPI0021AE2D3A|nr:GspH/FimT family pseudopilin [Aquabacterium sp. J223]UUX94601.1 GspH/FimT family pseudopilin [Aquabacterium sp. J223]
MRRRLSSSGFTVVEMMVVVVVVAVLLALAVPSFTDLLARQRLAAAGAELASNLQLARSEALQRQQQIGVAFSPADACYVVYPMKAADGCDCRTHLCDVGMKPIKFTTLEPAWAIHLSTTAPVLQLVPDRGAPVAAVSVTLTHGRAGSLVVTMAPSGSVSACANGAPLGSLPTC